MELMPKNIIFSGNYHHYHYCYYYYCHNKNLSGGFSPFFISDGRLIVKTNSKPLDTIFNHDKEWGECKFSGSRWIKMDQDPLQWIINLGSYSCWLFRHPLNVYVTPLSGYSPMRGKNTHPWAKMSTHDLKRRAKYWIQTWQSPALGQTCEQTNRGRGEREKKNRCAWQDCKKFVDGVGWQSMNTSYTYYSKLDTKGHCTFLCHTNGVPRAGIWFVPFFSRDSLCSNPLRQKQSSGKSRNNRIPARVTKSSLWAQIGYLESVVVSSKTQMLDTSPVLGSLHWQRMAGTVLASTTRSLYFSWLYLCQESQKPHSGHKLKPFPERNNITAVNHLAHVRACHACKYHFETEQLQQNLWGPYFLNLAIFKAKDLTGAINKESSFQHEGTDTLTAVWLGGSQATVGVHAQEQSQGNKAVESAVKS